MIVLTTKVEEIMTPNVLFLDQNESMEKVSEIFESKPIHHLPVVDEDLIVVGIVSKSDYYKLQHCLTFFQSSKIKEYNKALMRSLLVRDTMTKHVVTLFPDDPVSKAVDLFRENLFHAIPVVDKEKHLLGILTTFDLINFAFKPT